MARFKETELICFHDSQLIYVYMFRHKRSILSLEVRTAIDVGDM